MAEFEQDKLSWAAHFDACLVMYKHGDMPAQRAAHTELMRIAGQLDTFHPMEPVVVDDKQ